MAKFLLFNVPTTGHINQTLPVVAELVRRGHSVTYVLTEGYRERVEATGATFKTYQTIPDDYFPRAGLDGSNPIKTATTMIQTTVEVMPELISLVEAEQPDVILYDSMVPWGWLVAQHTGKPSASLMSLLIITMPLAMQSGMFFKLLPVFLRSIPLMGRHKRVSVALKEKYGATRSEFMDTMTNMGTITTVFTSAMFQPESEKLDKSIKFVGPIISERNDAGDFPLDQLTGDRLLIYIALGTVINQNPQFYADCLRAFKDTDYQVVMSVGKNTEVESLGAIPSNFIVRNFVPQLDVLQRADLFITHSGMNSVHEGLYYHVPLLLAPQALEQRFVAKRIEKLGGGLVLDDPTESTLRETAGRVLASEGIKQGARKLGDSFREAGGVNRAVDEILALVP